MKRHFYALTCAGLMLTGLAGCTYSVEKLVENEELRHKVLEECARMGISAKDEPNCINASKAQAKAAGNSVKGIFK